MRPLAALLLIFSLNMWAQQPKVQPPSSPEPGAQVRQEFLRAYNSKDAEAVAALYAENATLVSDGGMFRGRDEIRKWVMSGLDQGSTLEAIEPSVEKSSGNLAYGTGRTRRLVGSVVHLGQYLIVGEDCRGVEDCAALFAERRRNPSRELSRGIGDSPACHAGWGRYSRVDHSVSAQRSGGRMTW